MAELLGEWAVNGKIRYTKANTGWPMTRKKYTIKKYKYKTQMTMIAFYDTISMSFCFGFRIRRYSNGKRFIFVEYPIGSTYKNPILPEGYKEVITTIKSQIKHIC